MSIFCGFLPSINIKSLNSTVFTYYKCTKNRNFCDTHIIVQYTLFYEYKNSMTIFQVRETS